MDPEPTPGARPDESPGSLVVLALLAPLVGAAAGLLGAIFRLALEETDRFRDALIAGAHDANLAGLLFVASALLLGAVLAYMPNARPSVSIAGLTPLALASAINVPAKCWVLSLLVVIDHGLKP